MSSTTDRRDKAGYVAQIMARIRPYNQESATYQEFERWLGKQSLQHLFLLHLALPMRESDDLAVIPVSIPCNYVDEDPERCQIGDIPVTVRVGPAGIVIELREGRVSTTPPTKHPEGFMPQGNDVVWIENKDGRLLVHVYADSQDDDPTHDIEIPRAVRHDQV